MNKNMFTGDQMARLVAAQQSQGRQTTHEAIVQGMTRRARRRQKEGKHTRISRTNDGRRFTWHETKPLPEDVKAKARQKKKAAKKQKQKARKK